MFVGSNRTDEIQTAQASEPSVIVTIRIKDHYDQDQGSGEKIKN